MKPLPLALLLATLAWTTPVGADEHGHHHDFSDVERWVQRFEDPSRDEWQRPDEVVRFLALQPGAVVADIGAGTGYFARRLARAVEPGGKVLALDTEPNLVEYMRERARKESQANLEARLVEPADPGLGEGSVDMVFMCNTLHHVEGRPPYYAMLLRALRPGGRFVVVDYYPDREIPVGPPPEARLAPSAVVAEMEAAGFRAEVHELLPYQYVVVAEKP